jgi:modulator of FtsH protease
MKNVEITQNMQGQEAIEINRVLRNTYFLLSLTLLFSSACAYYALKNNVAPVGIIMFLAGAFGLQYLTIWLRNSPLGLAAIFAFTGFLGYTLGPLLNFYLHNFNNAPAIISTALGATGAIFLGLSAYTIVNRKNYSYMGGFIFALAIALMIVMIMGFAFHSPIVNVLVSGGFCVLSSSYILYTTSAIIHGGERNYIMATVSLFVALFNLFVSLLNILSFFAGNRN